MRPNEEDVQHLVTALFTVSGGLERARRRIPDAGTLAVLYAVGALDRARPSEIAAELGLHPSSVTRQIRVLEDAGRVAITADPDDGRSCFITLTAAGRDELDRLTQVGLGRFATFVADWDADEVRTLAQLLFKFEESKREVARREQRPGGRRWQQAAVGGPTDPS